MLRRKLFLEPKMGRQEEGAGEGGGGSWGQEKGGEKKEYEEEDKEEEKAVGRRWFKQLPLPTCFFPFREGFITPLPTPLGGSEVSEVIFRPR